MPGKAHHAFHILLMNGVNHILSPAALTPARK
jgi:hypothetical protein